MAPVNRSPRRTRLAALVSVMAIPLHRCTHRRPVTYQVGFSTSFDCRPRHAVAAREFLGGGWSLGSVNRVKRAYRVASSR